MITACVPDDKSRGLLDPPPDGVRLLVWDGTGTPPDGADQIEFLLAGYMGGAEADDMLSALPRLKVIQLLSAGVERWLAKVPPGVTLCNGRGVHGGATAELAVAGTLAIVRQLPFFWSEQAARRWTEQRTEDIDRKRLLVLGAGDIGTRIAAGLEVFGATTTYVARTARDDIRGVDDLAELAASADILAVAIPLTDDTRGLVDARVLAALPDNAIVVNIARGPIVDSAALTAELRAGRLRAFLDVTDPEPLPSDSPLWNLPNVLLTPHVGGGTTGWERRGFALVRDQLERLVRGDELRNVVGAQY